MKYFLYLITGDCELVFMDKQMNVELKNDTRTG